jgi:DNA (cytosine-5)-methyltransferase 1
VKTHSANHPAARHLCETLDQVDPRKLWPAGKLEILVASPECVHHSIARGGKPVNDQSRATAWHVVRWADALSPRTILVENVREFASWGPIGSNGKPLKSKRGETFQAWLQALRSLGYRTDYRLLNCADYGDATTRERLFVQAVRGKRPIRWPDPTHSATGEDTLFGRLPRWRAAREIIDWAVKGTSIFGRKRPLSANTLKRIEAGLKRFGGFPASFVLGQQSGAVARDVVDPLPTVATGGAISLIEPFVINARGTREDQMGGARSIDRPVHTVSAGGIHAGLIEPYLVKFYGQGEGVASLGEPLDTVTTRDRFALVTPWGLMDILFRMLRVPELAAAHSFPRDYVFKGSGADQVKQIGNSVPVGTSEALAYALLAG